MIKVEKIIENIINHYYTVLKFKWHKTVPQNHKNRIAMFTLTTKLNGSRIESKIKLKEQKYQK